MNAAPIAIASLLRQPARMTVSVRRVAVSGRVVTCKRVYIWR